MNTALLQMQGDNDQTVEYLHGVEWYNALRFDKDKRPPLHITVEKKPGRPAPVTTDSVRPKVTR